MKVIVDTNVLISAFVFGGNAERVLEKVLAWGEIVCSVFIFNELTRVLTEKFDVPAEKVNRILDSLHQVVVVIEPNSPLPNICRDPDDNYILQLAESANANFIVTGDKDLLALGIFGDTQIVSPSALLQII